MGKLMVEETALPPPRRALLIPVRVITDEGTPRRAHGAARLSQRSPGAGRRPHRQRRRHMFKQKVAALC